MRNSLIKPLNGGSPEMEIEPMSMVRPVTGIFFIKPPWLSMIGVPVCWIIAPAPRKSNDLKMA